MQATSPLASDKLRITNPVIPANSLVLAILVIVAVYLVARWVRARTTTDEAEQNRDVHYMIRSAGGAAAEHLGARSGLMVSRYYFRETDTHTGPPDSASFYDELFIDLKDASGQTWQNSIHVATPRGLERMMAEEHWDSVIGTELLIVRRYDLDAILHGAVEHLEEIYEAHVQIMGRGSPAGEPGAGD